MVLHIIKKVFNLNLLKGPQHKTNKKAKIRRTKKFSKRKIKENIWKLLKDEKSMKENHFILRTKANSARYYAEFLTNYRFCKEGNLPGRKFVKSVIYLTLQHMDSCDKTVVTTLLETLNNGGLQIGTQSNFEDVLKLFRTDEVHHLMILKNVIQKWMDVMPLLLEFKKYTDWDSLFKIKAHLLNSEDLFDIYINLLQYKSA